MLWVKAFKRDIYVAEDHATYISYEKKCGFLIRA